MGTPFDPLHVTHWMAEWGYLHDPQLPDETTPGGGWIPARRRTGQRVVIVHDRDAARLHRQVQALLRWRPTGYVPRVLDLPDPHVAILAGPIDIAVAREPRGGIWSAPVAGRMLRALHDAAGSARRPEHVDTTMDLPPDLAGLPRDLAHRADEVIARLPRRDVILHGNASPLTTRRNHLLIAPQWRYGHRAQDVAGYALATPDARRALMSLWRGYGIRPDRVDAAHCGRLAAIALNEVRRAPHVDTVRERMLERLGEDLLTQVVG